ncbi:MAG: thioredoxin-like domain-containing protein [Chryseolinea sp.]
MRFRLLLFFVLLSSVTFAQQGYKLKFRIEGLKDTTIYLGNYYGETTYIKDTAHVNNNGEFVFEGQKPLTYRGVYFIVLDKQKQFELIIGDNQHFSLSTRKEDYVKFMKVTGDLDNQLFFENMVYNMERHFEAQPYSKVILDSTLTEDKKKDARTSYNKINDKVMAHQADIIFKHPQTLTAKILKANQPVKIPDAPKRPDGSVDSTFQLRWYREHFFDNFDLAEPGLISLPRPLYKEKINEYLDKLYAPQADSITKATDRFISKAKKNQETYKYATWMALLKYQQPEIMGLDEVYVNLYDKYFGSGEMNFWVNEKLNKNLKEHADRLRKSLVGKQGANLIMQDSNLKRRSMYDIKNKYTVLFIFDPDCGHCKEETPKLVSFYNKKKYDVEIFAVSADTSMQKMRDYIKDMHMPGITVNGPRTYVGPYLDLYDAMQTPSLYILDRTKKIIAKKVPAEKLEDFFAQYEKFEKLKAADKPKPTKL